MGRSLRKSAGANQAASKARREWTVSPGRPTHAVGEAPEEIDGDGGGSESLCPAQLMRNKKEVTWTPEIGPV